MTPPSASALLTYINRSTKDCQTLQLTQRLKLDATINQIKIILESGEEWSARELQAQLEAVESRLRLLPVESPLLADATTDELDDELFLPSVPPTPSLVALVVSPQVTPVEIPPPPLPTASASPSLSTSTSSSSPPPLLPPPPPRSRVPPPPPPPPPKSTFPSPARSPAPSPGPSVRPRRASRAFGPTFTPTPSDPSDPPSSTPTSTLLEHHASLQTSLLSSLTSMSSQLKTNSQAFSASLEKDKEVMLSAQDKLDGNLVRMKKEGGRLGSYEKKGRGMVWITIGLVGAVAAMWVGTFLLIRVT